MGGGAGPESWGACPPLPNYLPRNSAAGTRGEGAEGPGWQHSFGQLVAAPGVVLLLTLRGEALEAGVQLLTVVSYLVQPVD